MYFFGGEEDKNQKPNIGFAISQEPGHVSLNRNISLSYFSPLANFTSSQEGI